MEEILTLYVARRSIHVFNSAGLRICFLRVSYCKHTPKSQSKIRNILSTFNWMTIYTAMNYNASYVYVCMCMCVCACVCVRV